MHPLLGLFFLILLMTATAPSSADAIGLRDSKDTNIGIGYGDKQRGPGLGGTSGLGESEQSAPRMTGTQDTNDAEESTDENETPEIRDDVAAKIDTWPLMSKVVQRLEQDGYEIILDIGYDRRGWKATVYDAEAEERLRLTIDPLAVANEPAEGAPAAPYITKKSRVGSLR